ncbi:MAG: hypothetical protein AAGD47_11875 [Pseudomonadota bacterium]
MSGPLLADGALSAVRILSVNWLMQTPAGNAMNGSGRFLPVA